MSVNKGQCIITSHSKRLLQQYQQAALLALQLQHMCVGKPGRSQWNYSSLWAWMPGCHFKTWILKPTLKSRGEMLAWLLEKAQPGVHQGQCLALGFISDRFWGFIRRAQLWGSLDYIRLHSPALRTSHGKSNNKIQQSKPQRIWQNAWRKIHLCGHHSSFRCHWSNHVIYKAWV